VELKNGSFMSRDATRGFVFFAHIELLLNQSTNQPLNQITSTSQPANQPTNPPTNQPTNPPTNQPTKSKPNKGGGEQISGV
jgi:hypothetical protein